MTQEKLAKKLNISLTLLKKLLSGERSWHHSRGLSYLIGLTRDIGLAYMPNEAISAYVKYHILKDWGGDYGSSD